MDATGETENRAPRVRGPIRTCVGCLKQDAPGAFLRVVLGPVDDHGAVPFAIDLSGGTAGRGAHVHGNADCITKACRSGFARSFRTKISWTPAQLVEQLEGVSVRRIEGLVSGACRAQLVAIGADAVKESVKESASLVLVASDAASIAQSEVIRTSIATGNALVFLNKSALGALLGRDEVAVLAIQNEGIADEIKRVYSLADAVRGQRTGRLGV